MMPCHEPFSSLRAKRAGTATATDTATAKATDAATDTAETDTVSFGPRARPRSRRRPSLGNPGASDPVVRGLALWRRAVAGRWTMLGIVLGVSLALVSPPGALADVDSESSRDGSSQGEAPEGETTLTGLLLRIEESGEDGGDERKWLEAPGLETEVSLQVTGAIVRARVTQRFSNPRDRWVEGLYVFPLPETAAVDGLRMIVGDHIVEGQIQEKEAARRVYEQAKRDGNRASLVEQERPNLFLTRVANIGPGEEVTVELHYQQSLDWDSGAFRLRFPMTITPRYDPCPEENRAPVTVLLASEREGPGVGPEVDEAVSGSLSGSLSGLPALQGGAQVARAGQRSVAATGGSFLPAGVRRALVRTGQVVENAVEKIYDPSPPVQPLRLQVELDAGVPLASLVSSYHAIDVDAIDGERGRYEVSLARGAVSADREFELVWRPELGAEPRSALFTETLGPDTFALLMVLPPDPELSGFRRLPRETVFVLDVSGSMQGASIRQARQALVLALDRLAPEDSFNVLTFSSRTTALFPGSWPAEPEVIEKAKSWVGNLKADGGTVMLPALLAALDGRPEGYGRSGERAVQQVIFITDGAVGNEDELFTAIERHLGEARLFTVGIGSAPNGHLLRRVAELGRGSFTYIGSPQQVLGRMDELFAKLESPALTGVEVRWDDPGAEMYPQRVPDLYAGEPVVVAAKLADPGDEVRLTGERDGVWWDQRLDVGRRVLQSGLGATVVPASGPPVVPGLATSGGVGAEAGIGKLWARSKITALLDEWRRAPAQAPDGSPSPQRAELRSRVVALALGHHLVSRFTSLVAVDVTPARPDGAPLDSRPLPNVRPAGAAWEMPGFLPSGGTSARGSLALGLVLLALALVLRRLLPPEAASGAASGGTAGAPGNGSEKEPIHP